MTMTIKAAAYRDLTTQWRRAYAELEAEDRQHNAYYGYRAGFGPPPDVVQFRHARANPNESGSLADDIAKVL